MSSLVGVDTDAHAVSEVLENIHFTSGRIKTSSFGVRGAAGTGCSGGENCVTQTGGDEDALLSTLAHKVLTRGVSLSHFSNKDSQF